MEQALFPWWLTLLVGLWTVGLTCWLNDRCSLSLRSYAGWCCLAYTALLWIVLTTGSSSRVGETDVMTRLWLLRTLAGVALVAAFGTLGPVSPKWRAMALIVFGLSTGGVCLCLGKPMLAGACLATAALVMIRELRNVRQNDTPKGSPAEPSKAWLIGMACGVCALGLLGVLRWSTQVEFPQAPTFDHLPQKPLQSPEGMDSEWLQRHPEFPWLAAGLLVTALALWDARPPAASNDPDQERT